MKPNERRLRKLEQSISKPKHGFTASLKEANPPLEAGDSRLRRGIEEFIFTHPENGATPLRKETRGHGYVNPWTEVEFWGGGKRTSWNKALAVLRVDPYLNNDKEGRTVNGWVEFIEESGELTRHSHVTFLGWSPQWWAKYHSAMEENPIPPERMEEWGRAILGQGPWADTPKPPERRIQFQDWHQPAIDRSSSTDGTKFDNSARRRERLQKLGIVLGDGND